MVSYKNIFTFRVGFKANEYCNFLQIPFMYAGFTNGAVKACCGGGGPYNFNNSARCGHTGSKSCNSPSTFANWDGVHLTEAAYRYIATGLIDGPFTSPPLQFPID